MLDRTLLCHTIQRRAERRDQVTRLSLSRCTTGLVRTDSNYSSNRRHVFLAPPPPPVSSVVPAFGRAHCTTASRVVSSRRALERTRSAVCARVRGRSARALWRLRPNERNERVGRTIRPNARWYKRFGDRVLPSTVTIDMSVTTRFVRPSRWSYDTTERDRHMREVYRWLFDDDRASTGELVLVNDEDQRTPTDDRANDEDERTPTDDGATDAWKSYALRLLAAWKATDSSIVEPSVPRKRYLSAPDFGSHAIRETLYRLATANFSVFLHLVDLTNARLPWDRCECDDCVSAAIDACDDARRDEKRHAASSCQRCSRFITNDCTDRELCTRLELGRYHSGVLGAVFAWILHRLDIDFTTTHVDQIRALTVRLIHEGNIGLALPFSWYVERSALRKAIRVFLFRHDLQKREEEGRSESEYEQRRDIFCDDDRCGDCTCDPENDAECDCGNICAKMAAVRSTHAYLALYGICEARKIRVLPPSCGCSIALDIVLDHTRDAFTTYLSGSSLAELTARRLFERRGLLWLHDASMRNVFVPMKQRMRRVAQACTDAGLFEGALLHSLAVHENASWRAEYTRSDDSLRYRTIRSNSGL